MKYFYTCKGLLLIVVSLFFLGTQETRASHIPGANITATCNPSNPLEYTFTLTLFRRCPGTHPSTMSNLNFTLSNDCGLTNPIVPTFQQVGTEVDVNQLCSGVTSNCSGGTQPGVWLYTYEATIILPANCDGWTLAYELCCRDASSNMSGGAGNDMYTSTTINTLTAPCNTTPRVTSAPIPYACTNTPFTYCLTTADAEGDSVAYRMVPPSNGGGVPITHLAGYSIASPLTGFTLNPLTGCFTFNEPNVGNYVVAIAIDEYDGAGNIISTVVHDFQVQVINCTNTPPNNPIGSITNVTGTGSQTGPNSVSACLGQSFCFDVTFSDAVDVNDSIFITTDGTTLFPGATFTTTGVNPVTGTFCWNVVPGSMGGSVTFNAFDNGCPVRGTNSFGVVIDIIDGVYAGPDASVCGGVPVQLNATGGTVFNWSPATGLSCTNCPNPVASPAVTTTYVVTGNLSGSCSNTDTVVVNVENVPPTASIAGNIGICGTGSNTLTASGGSRFLWSTGATTPSITVSPTVSTSYSVIVTNFVGGCEAYDTVDVVVSPGVVSNIPDQIICNGNSTTLSASGGGTYAWSTGETTPDITVSPTVTTDYFVTITLGTCSVIDTINVTVTPTSGPVINCQADTTLAPCAPAYNYVLPTALDYCAPSPCISNTLADVLAGLNSNGNSIAGNIPNGYNMTDGITGTCVNDGGNDMYDCGNQLNTNLTTLIPYTGGNINTNPGFNGGSYFTHKFNNLWVMAADLNGVTTFFTSGNNGADGSGNVDGYTYTVTVGCMSYYVFVKRINAAGDPSINHIYIVPDNGTLPAPTHTFSNDTNNDEHRLSNLGNFDRLYYLLLAGSGGYAYTNAEIEAAVLDFINQSNVTAGGVAQAPVTQIAGPANGTVLAPGTHTFTFQAVGSGGTSTCSYDVIVPPANVPVIACNPDTIISQCIANNFAYPIPVGSDPCNASCGNTALATILTDLNANGNAIASNVPSGFNMLDGITGTNISDGGSDMYDGGNTLNTNLGTAIPYTGGSMSSSASFGAGTNYFTHKFNNLWVMAADLNGVSTFRITGNNGADGSGTADGFTSTITVGCQSYYLLVKRVHSAFDPSINHIFIVPDNGTLPAPTHTFPTNTDNDEHVLNNLDNFDRLYYLLLAGSGGINYTNAQLTAAATDFLTQVNAASGVPGSGVTVTQIAGLPSGSNFPVGTNTVTFRATSNLSGLTADCSFDIIVQPSPAPIIVCRPDTTVSECNPVVTFATPTAVDGCGVPCTNATLADVLTDLNTNGNTIASNVPSGFNMLDGITGTSISDGGSDMYDGGNTLNTNIGTAIPYTGGAMSTSANFGAGSSYFTHKFNNLWVMGADLNGVSTFSITGNNGADGSGTADGFTSTVTVGCQSYYILVKRVHSAFDPSINHIFIVPDNGTLPAPTHTFPTNTDNDEHVLNNLDNFDRLYYLLLAGSGGINYTNAQLTAAATDFLTQVNASAGVTGGGATVAQVAGLPSGSSFPVGTNTVTFRATSSTTGQTADCSFDIVVQPRPVATITGNTTVCTGGSTTLTASGGGTYLWSTGATTASVTVSPLLPTTYTVSVTDNLGCEGQNNISTTVGTPSTPPVLAPITGSICPNTSLTLTAAGGTAGTGSAIQWYSGPNGTGTWLGTGGSLAVSPTTATTYYARREGGCNITGDDQVTVNLKDYIYALNAATTNTYCTDNMGWHHFYNGNEIILSIRGDLTGAPAGFPLITINDNGTYFQQTQGPFTPASCTNFLTPGEERFEMERSWDVNFGGGTLNPPYEVRFYYEPGEKTAVENAALNHMATYPACGYSYKYAVPMGSYFFKNTGSQYTAPDFDGLHLPTTTGVTPNGINYAELTGITNFSGGSLGLILIPNTLLPVEWLYFEGSTDNTTNTLRWATASEQNTDYFRVQRSPDGVTFETIGTVQAQGQSSSTKHYTYEDNHPFEGQNYYRLELVDQTGEESLSKTILLQIRVDGQPYLFYPNPTTGVVYYQYESQQAETLQVEVLDVLGKRAKMEQVQGTTGINNIPVNLEGLPTGTYMIRVHNEARGTVHTEKVTKRDF